MVRALSHVNATVRLMLRHAPAGPWWHCKQSQAHQFASSAVKCRQTHAPPSACELLRAQHHAVPFRPPLLPAALPFQHVQPPAQLLSVPAGESPPASAQQQPVDDPRSNTAVCMLDQHMYSLPESISCAPCGPAFPAAHAPSEWPLQPSLGTGRQQRLPAATQQVCVQASRCRLHANAGRTMLPVTTGAMSELPGPPGWGCLQG